MKPFTSVIVAICSCTILLQCVVIEESSAQTFKVIIAKFDDRTGFLARKETEAMGGVVAGGVAGRGAAAGAASGQVSTASMESGKGDLGSQAADIFTTELVKTNKFRVLDRNMFVNILDTTNHKGDMIAAAKAMGAHYLLTGAVTQAGISEGGGSVVGFGAKTTKGKATIDVRFTNIATGEVRLAESAEGEQGEGGAVLFGGHVGSKKDLGLLISSALRDAVQICSQKIVEAAGDLSNYPIECDAATNEGKIYLSRGSDDGVQAGDKFEAIGFGKTIMIGTKKIQEKTTKGILRVTDVATEYAVAVPEGDFTVSEGDKAVKIVTKRIEPVKKKEE